MAFSIELNFDEESNFIIKKMWKKLREKDISDYMDIYGVFPHISLAIIEDINVSEVGMIIEKSIEGEVIFDIKLSGVGSFPSDEGVLFLSVDHSDTLINFHKILHKHLEHINGHSKYYLPGFWFPHCTLGMNIDKLKMQDAFDIIKEDFVPLDVRIETIKLIEFDPVKVIQSYRLPVGRC